MKWTSYSGNTTLKGTLFYFNFLFFLRGHTKRFVRDTYMGYWEGSNDSSSHVTSLDQTPRRVVRLMLYSGNTTSKGNG